MRIREEFGHSYVDGDAIHWLPNWTMSPLLEKQELLRLELAGSDWVIDSYSSAFRVEIDQKVERILWLDEPLGRCLLRLMRRSRLRIRDRLAICNGNYESWPNLIFGKDALFPFVLRTHGNRRQRYLAEVETRPEVFRRYDFGRGLREQLWIDSGA